MRSFSKNIIDAHAIASNNSVAVDCNEIYAASFIGKFSVSDAEGTLKIQASNETPVGGVPISGVYVPAEASWADVPSATVSVTAGATSLVPMPVSFSYKWLRAVWTRSAGTGTITVQMNLQGF